MPSGLVARGCGELSVITYGKTSDRGFLRECVMMRCEMIAGMY